MQCGGIGPNSYFSAISYYSYHAVKDLLLTATAIP